MKQREMRSWLMDMDGVLVREEQLPFLVLANNSMYTPRSLRTARTQRDSQPGERDLDSALATADFLQASGRTARRSRSAKRGC